jgi:hypothetical protein
MIQNEESQVNVATIQLDDISESKDKSAGHEPFLPPILLHHNPSCGNYFVASRPIEPGELIFEELAISDSAFGFPSTRPDCLTCFKDLSYSQKCKRCKWPTCNKICSAASKHSNFECDILWKNQVQYKAGEFGGMEYLGIETLRCLLLREKFPMQWNSILKLESHIVPRNGQMMALKEIEYIVNFVRIRCKLVQFHEQLIIQILGIIAVNAFGGITCSGRCVSLLFGQASLFNHDCRPNTMRQIWENDGEEFEEKSAGTQPMPNPNPKKCVRFSMRLIATRSILPGEVISTNYGDLDAGIVERGKFLMYNYHFHCDCHRCRFELFREIHHLISE